MSRLTTTPLKTAFPAANSTPVSPGGTVWTNGDWVEFIDFTGGTNTAIAGICFQDDTQWSGLQLEVGIGVGDEGNETEIGHIRFHMPASGNGGPTQYLLPYPVSGLPNGTRVSLRYRSNDAAGPDLWDATLLYYEDLDSDQQVDFGAALLTSFPAGTDSISVVPNATPWADSAWFEFDPAVGEPTFIFGVAMGNAPPGEVDAEIDLGIGPMGSEVVLTTFRYGSYNLATGRINFASLPGLMPIPSGSRLVGRLRKGSAETDVLPVAFLGYLGPLETAVIQVFKETNPDGSPQSFDFSTDLTPSTFSLTDGQAQLFTDVVPGTYSIEEIDIPAGWTLTSVVVSNGDDPSAITIGAGETVTVTFTNTQDAAPASLIICKETVPGGSPQEFDFEAGPGLDPATFSLSDGECQTYEDITPGTYSAEEVNVPDGWTLTNIAVSNGDPNTAITIAEGETVTVTFTNEQSSECPGDRGAPPIGI